VDDHAAGIRLCPFLREMVYDSFVTRLLDAGIFLQRT
jgi:hypothetical protein